MEETIEIPVSKTKMAFLLAGSVLFVLLAIWIIFTPRSGIGIKVVAIIGIFFFGAGIFIFIKKLFDNESNLVIDKNGVSDNFTRPKVGIIAWDDIVRVEISKIVNTKMLLIYVKDPEKYLQRVKSQGLRNNYKLVGTPFVIPSSILKIKLEKLENLINERLEEYNHAYKS